ncbi:MAG TPA: DUF2149 domain-containing protein [Solirubrobacterales bacterium]|nr:DUF2149 domain-containing protein [Solirubrobacterales bacterium]
MSRVGLGRHGPVDADVGDPLDSLVNLFDLGLVLAVAFLIAGLSLGGAALGSKEHKPPQGGRQTTVKTPKTKQTASGEGESVGQVYRLPDGRLVLVGPDGKPVEP